jgi:hypothetical protein
MATAALWTAGHRNIAVTGCAPAPPQEAEAEALRRYDLIVCPREADITPMRQRAVAAVVVEPEVLPALVQTFLEQRAPA